ncbi:MAG: DUF177 domain-containing protein [Pseudomonadota bacterium]
MEPSRISSTNPEFARVIEVARLKEAGHYQFEISPEPEECQALAGLLGVRAIRKMRFSGELAPVADEGWRLSGVCGATVVQTCVITLEAVTTRVDVPVRRDYLPVLGDAPSDILLSPQDDDEIDPLGREIDLGLVAIEALALALPAYPRKPGAELETTAFAADGVAPLQDADLKPFASLAALKKSLSDKSSGS